MVEYSGWGRKGRPFTPSEFRQSVIFKQNKKFQIARRPYAKYLEELAELEKKDIRTKEAGLGVPTKKRRTTKKKSVSRKTPKPPKSEFGFSIGRF